MALITISGFPCAGKTRRAEQIRNHLEAFLKDAAYSGPHLSVSYLSDDVLNIDRNVYDDSRTEKPARAALFTAIQRQMSQSTILIVDAPNYIKGFRYQMYCAARELKLRVCTIYVMATPELCREWNSARGAGGAGGAYVSETLDSLISRYEEPSSMVRWDSPLFTVTWTDGDVPAAQIWEAVTKGIVKPPNAGTQTVVKAPTDALRAVEETTSSVVSAIMTEQGASQGQGGLITLLLSAAPSCRITLPPRNITLSELQRFKRQFVTVHKKAITLGTTEKGVVDWSQESIVGRFTTYLEENLKS